MVSRACRGATMPESALSGLKVVEAGDFISPAYGSKLLADLGADVIKVEPPGGGSIRKHGPFPGDDANIERGGLHLFLDANKRSVTLDLESSEGAGLFRELARWADIVIHNIDPGLLERLGIRYEDLKVDHPALIMSSITVFGYDTPYRDWKGSALTATAASGLSQRIGDPGKAPLWIPYCAADFQGGLHGAIAAMAALQARRATGEGQHAWVSIVEVLGNYLGGSGVPAFVFGGQTTTRAGTHMPGFYPWEVAETADGYFEVITMVDAQWRRFVELMGNPEWGADERLQNRWTAPAWRDELDAFWHPWMKERTRAELWQVFRDNHIAFQPVQTVDEVVASPHLQARGFWQEIEHPVAGAYSTLGPPFRLSATPWELRSRPPLLGEHNADVLGGILGQSPAQLERLKSAGVTV